MSDFLNFLPRICISSFYELSKIRPLGPQKFAFEISRGSGLGRCRLSFCWLQYYDSFIHLFDFVNFTLFA